MKKSAKLFLTALALVSCAAGAQTVYSGQSDQDRRERNRQEALSNYRASNGTTTSTTTTTEPRSSVRQKTHRAAESTRHGAHRVAESTRRVTHKSANAVRRVGHKTAQKARDVTARADAKFGTVPRGKANPDGINPVGVSSASPTAPSAGTTK